MKASRTFADRDFEHLGIIALDRDYDGEIRTFLPQSNYHDARVTPLHAYGAGPFCRFRIARKRRDTGLYVLTLDDVPVYAGECVDVGRRWGPNGYGGISPRNCFRGGQPTNCRVNAAILVEALQRRRIDLWFAPFSGTHDERLRAETALIRTLDPAWNRAKRSATSGGQL
jgi:hypothetical protein